MTWQTSRIVRLLLPLGFAVTLLGQAEQLCAGPPLRTDDPETPGRKGWEINISHNIERTTQEFRMESPRFDVNHGFLENDQFKVEFPVLYVDLAEESSHWGIGDLLVGYKYRFLEEDRTGFMGSIYPQILIPVGSQSIGLGSGSAELILPVQLGKHLFDDNLFVYAEVGYDVVLEESEANSWLCGLAAEWKVTEKWEAMGEVGGLFTPGDADDADPDDVFFNFGTKYDFTENLAFIGSVGRSFRDRDRGTPDLLTFVGFQITWGGEGESNDDGESRPAEAE